MCRVVHRRKEKKVQRRAALQLSLGAAAVLFREYISFATANDSQLPKLQIEEDASTHRGIMEHTDRYSYFLIQHFFDITQECSSSVESSPPKENN